MQCFALHPIDAQIGRALKKAVPSDGFEMLPFSASVDATMRQLAGFDYVVGQRLHATVLACAQGVPNLSLSYQPKCLDFLDSIKQPELALPTEEITSGGLIERFEWLVQSRTPVRNAVVAECDRLRTIQHAARVGTARTTHEVLRRNDAPRRYVSLFGVRCISAIRR